MIEKGMTGVTTILVILFVTACASGPRVSGSQDPGADFSGYQTYAFASPLATDRPDGAVSLLSKYLTDATRRELNARNYRETGARPDLVVNFYVNTEEKIRARTSPARDAYYGYRRGYYSVWAGYPTETEVYQYTEGTLHIDIVDRKTNQMIWEGVAEGRVPRDIREKLRETVNEVVPEIFTQYPVAAGR